VYHLVKDLSKNKSFNIFINNYFSNINLFKYLKNKGFDAYGTIRTNFIKFSKVLEEKVKQKLNWNFLLEVVVDKVLVLLWIDNICYQFLLNL